MIGDALSGGGVYTSDEDPELIREALPFGLKTYESLLDVSPDLGRQTEFPISVVHQPNT